MNICKTSIHYNIFRALRDRIIYLEYPPGMNISEKALCEEFRVSRTPVREALRKLEDAKLVTAIPRFGTYVTQIDINEIRCAFEVKAKLEGLAGGLAAKRMTPDKLEELGVVITEAVALQKGDHRKLVELDARFHQVLYEAAQNEILRQFLENLHSRCARLWTSSLSEIIPNEEVARQLKEIQDVLKKRDSENAALLMERHVRYFVDHIKMQLL
jgi:DNA-binding GntR family transcriptional regulator